jgi:hypothetical protein
MNPMSTATLDLLSKLNMSAKRAKQMDQLCNDITEDMNLKHWKPKDYQDCIRYLMEWRAALLNEHFRFSDSVTSAIFKAKDEYISRTP